MGDDIFISFHAPSLSYVLYETVRSINDQWGLLIGEVCNELINKTTDANETHEEHNKVIYVEYCVPINKNVFDNFEVNKKVLNSYITNYPEKIVGWYSFKRNCRGQTCSMKETVFHKALLEALPSINKDLFIIALLNASISQQKSTHKYSQTFLRYDELAKKFEPVRMKVFTLSDECRGQNGYSVYSCLPTSAQFDKIISETRTETNPVKYVLQVQEKANTKLLTFHQKLLEINRNRIDLEDKISEMNDILKEPNQNNFEVKTTVVKKKTEDPILQTVKFDPKKQYNNNGITNPFACFEEAARAPRCVPSSDEPRRMSYASATSQVGTTNSSSKQKTDSSNNLDGEMSSNHKPQPDAEVSLMEF